MKYIIRRVSVWNDEISPCKEATLEEVTEVHHCTCNTLEETLKRPEVKSWFWAKDKFGHKKIPGISGVICYSKTKTWVVNDKIENMYKKYGRLVIQHSDYVEYPIEIEIYDNYRE